MRIFILILAMALAAGCGPSAGETGKKNPESKSVAREAIEGFTGKTAADNLKGAKPKIAVAGEAEKQKRDDVDNLAGQ